MKKEFSQRLRLLASLLSLIALVALLGLGWVYLRLRASLPTLDGTAQIPGLTATARIERDAQGVVTVSGANRADVARALGYAHAQDRFFQMDTLRRASAGELAALVGSQAVSHDRAIRIHGFRRLAQEAWARLPADHRTIAEAYAAGVNAGLASLGARPFEYLLLRTDPQPWQPEDCLLVSYAMLIDLQDATAKYERTLLTLRDQLGVTGLAFFAPLLTTSDAALDGTRGEVPEIPGPAVINLRGETTAEVEAPLEGASLSVDSGSGPDSDFHPGSNAFALSGAHTATGAALLASDMHLTLRLPNTWYRASLKFGDRSVHGLTLPGVPLVVAGSNGRVAWSFTNSYADTGDVVRFDVNPVAPHLYRAPGHEDLLKIEKRTDTIEVRGEKPVTVETDWTLWGPVIGRDQAGRRVVYRWLAHDAAATDLNLLRMEDATDVKSAIAVAHEAGMPTQNIFIADAAGDVAWTLAGRLPRRVGYDGRLPVSFQFGDRSWDGFVPAADIPVVTTAGATGTESPLHGRLWSGNQRMVGGEALAVVGDGGYARPHRAGMIRDGLAKLERATPQDLLAVQLDDRATFLEPWHKLLLKVLNLPAAAQKEDRVALRGYVETWEGRASVDAVAYPVVKLFRIAVYTRMYQPIFRSCTEANPQFAWGQLLLEDSAWRLLEVRPMHLLDPQYSSWDALLLSAVDEVLGQLNQTGVRLKYQTWGQRNRAEIRHPFSYSLPSFVRGWLDMPAHPLPGDVDMPRVQGRTHGASNRFVVSPGREAEGICHVPGGQSGHPLSPFYRAGHEAWAKGEPTPFLPGEKKHTLVLEPAAQPKS